MGVTRNKKLWKILDWLESHHFCIGNLEFSTWNESDLKGNHKKHFCFEPDCEHCPFGWDSFSYEGECEDCGCCIDYHFNTPKIYCAIPWRIKNLIKKWKGWD